MIRIQKMKREKINFLSLVIPRLIKIRIFLIEMFDEMPFLNNVKRAIIYRNKKLTIGELIANFNSKTHWDKNSYYFMINNCQNRITNIIICL